MGIFAIGKKYIWCIDKFQLRQGLASICWPFQLHRNTKLSVYLGSNLAYDSEFQRTRCRSYYTSEKCRCKCNDHRTPICQYIEYVFTSKLFFPDIDEVEKYYLSIQRSIFCCAEPKWSMYTANFYKKILGCVKNLFKVSIFSCPSTTDIFPILIRAKTFVREA
jgi:hypothetical protein